MKLKFMISIRKTLVLSAALVISVSGYSQEEGKKEQRPTGQVVDRIIAKVDNNIILESDLQKAYLEAVARSQQGFEAPTKCEVFESMLVNKMMVAKAEIDSVVVTEAEIIIQTDKRFNMTMQQSGGDEETLVEAYG